MNNIKKSTTIFLALTVIVSFCLPVCSNTQQTNTLSTYGQNQNNLGNLPLFKNPVVLLVGISSNELSYREFSGLTGFELFSVPYRSDIKSLVSQIEPSQIIIKHPSGFTGLYTPEGQLVRGVEVANGAQVSVNTGSIPPSIIQPTEANPIFENQYYPGSLTGSVPHGGVGYVTPPKGRSIKRHFLKLAALTGLVPFQYPGYFEHFDTLDREKLFPTLLFSSAPLGIGAAAQYADARLDAAEYEQARAQPRDYMFQPVIEGY